uniref:Uncharacterized protein n=1 Tax=Rhodococcus hoagii TaxID=43767 RepID=A0A1Z1UXF7_RHOHA|nr:hypothetical protein [Prescottella equi]
MAGQRLSASSPPAPSRSCRSPRPPASGGGANFGSRGDSRPPSRLVGIGRGRSALRRTKRVRDQRIGYVPGRVAVQDSSFRARCGSRWRVDMSLPLMDNSAGGAVNIALSVVGALIFSRLRGPPEIARHRRHEPVRHLLQLHVAVVRGLGRPHPGRAQHVRSPHRGRDTAAFMDCGRGRAGFRRTLRGIRHRGPVVPLGPVP